MAWRVAGSNSFKTGQVLHDSTSSSGCVPGTHLNLGPAISYSKAWSKENKVSLTLRWLKEFDVKNRIQGEPLELNVSISL